MPSTWPRPYAEKYNTSERTILRMKKLGVDLESRVEVESWLATRANRSRAKQPVATKIVKARRGTAQKAKVDALQGAQHALRRLEGEEAHLFEELQAAKTPLQQADRRKAWLQTMEALKKFDMLVEAGRRDAGEVITRAQMQPVLTNIAVWLRRGNEDFLNSICLQISEADTPQKVYAAIEPSIRQSVTSAVDAATKDGKLPGWVREALISGL